MAHLVKLYRAGEHTISELEELFAVTRSTVYRAVRRARAAASDAAA
jgi:DNA-binding MarR family transcriptional regulator